MTRTVPGHTDPASDEPPLGAWLLRQARGRGMTGDQLAGLLGLPLHRIRRLADITDLDDLPVRTLRTLAQTFDLAWPRWLTPTAGTPPAPASDHNTATARDTDRVHAVLALHLGRPLHPDQLAQILNLPPARVHDAVARLLPPHADHLGLRLAEHPDGTLQLSVRPQLLDTGTHGRLERLAHQQQGPPPSIALLMFHLSRRDQASAVGLLRNTPELAEHAAAAGYITYQLRDGQPTNIKLTADVAFSLEIPLNLHDTLLLPPRTTPPAPTAAADRPAADPAAEHLRP